MIGNLAPHRAFLFPSRRLAASTRPQTRKRSSCSEAASTRRLTPPASRCGRCHLRWRHHRDRQPQRRSRFPQNARVIDCAGKTVVAGFWNSHVHFTQAVWRNAASAPAAPLEEHMQEMLTKWGFTTVWDLGSDPSDTACRSAAASFRRSRGSQYLSCRQHFPEGRSSRLSAGRIATPRSRHPGRSDADGTRLSCEWAWTGSSFSPAPIWATSPS